MISGLKPKKLLYRDGTGQAQRLMDALNPSYINIDERSIGDLVGFAQEYAKELIFFDSDNNPAGNWEAFLIDDIDSYNKKTDDEKLSQRKKWIADILDYIDNPGKFSNDAEKTRKLSRPHLILFVSFLQLLGYIKDQMNGFTKKHLDFYYFEVLGLTKKKPLPDVVNVIIELADDIDEFFVEEGTLLFAGKDSLGKDLIYKTDKNTTVSPASIQSIKTLFVDKKVITIKDAREDNTDDEDEGFTKMMQLALGDPDPGDELPGKPDDLTKVTPDYIQNQLFLSVTDFNFLISLKPDGKVPKVVTADQWQSAYDILDTAYKEKVKWNRQQDLKKVREADANREEGFARMFEFAFGDPEPLDDLPIYKGGAVDFAILSAIYDQLGSTEAGIKFQALKYVTEELLLSEAQFKNSIETFNKDNATEQDWIKVYSDIEKAQRQKRNYQISSPSIERSLNIYAVDDARANAFSLDREEGESSLRFNTFGKGQAVNELTNARPANIGFAISSPQLALSEGKRTITLTVSFKKSAVIKLDEITDVLSGPAVDYQPFLFFLSNQKGWTQLRAANLQYGNIIVKDSLDNYTATLKDKLITKTTGDDFNAAKDKGKYIIWSDGAIYAIDSVKGPAIVEVTRVGFAAKPQVIKKYSPEDIYFNAMQVQLYLDENEPAVNIPGDANEFISIKSAFPVIGMVLNQIPVFIDGSTETGKYINMYQQFKDLELEKIKVKTDVSNITALTLQNDNAVLDYKKPFEPFGYKPESSNSLYFAHPEICGKQLDTLTLNFEWMNPPVLFRNYYENYWKIKLAKGTLNEPEYEIPNNSVFTAELKFIDNSAVIPLDPAVKLFRADNAQKTNSIDISIAELIATNRPAYAYTNSELPAEEEEVLDWKRYFSLQLGPVDFQHNSYPILLTKQAFFNPVPTSSTDKTLIPNPLRELTLNPPYTPKLKSLTAAYTASFEVNLTEGLARNNDSIFHINAFGYNQLEIAVKKGISKNTWFLPYFKNEGELYIGLDKLELPQNLSILFQMAEGSADPDLEKKPISWSYLGNNEWVDLKGDEVVSDTTNGLINTGIIELSIPENADKGNSLLNEGLYWLKASVSDNTAAVSDTVDIFTQGISAVFADDENADDHLLTLLPPGSIKETVVEIPEIKKITQPYTSSKGKPAEVDQLFYNRVSERLRHKNRALTMWDYERIVLEQFPEIYKAKCIPAEFSGKSTDSGKVDVIVIPDIKGKLPFNPFQPKVPADTIFEIQKYLEERMPAYAIVKVKNPSYLQVKTRFAVKIKEGYNTGFFTKKLEEELKKYLAPWAYNEGADIVLGGKIYANVIVNFIAERPYVEYVAGIKLFQSEDGILFTDVRTLNDGENVVKADRPDVILVSALEHEIDMITDEGFKEKDFTGIGYMRVELDFIVG